MFEKLNGVKHVVYMNKIKSEQKQWFKTFKSSALLTLTAR